MSVGSLPNVHTRDHVVNSIISKGAKIFLSSNIHVNRYTPKKNLPFIKRMCEAGILIETKTKPKNTIALFAVPKTDPSNPRMIMDFKPFTKLVNAPTFKLPNINKLVKRASPTDHMIKMDLTNGFFHINLHPKTCSLFGIKCKNKYYNITKLPQGLSISPYLMQCTMESIIAALLGNICVKFLVYLDDIILLGSPDNLEKAKTALFASPFLFNLAKCELTSTRVITYLGVTVDLIRETFNLTKNFVRKVTLELIKIKKYRITTRYKQRVAGLLNFAIPILRLPFQFIHLAFHHHRKLYKFANFIHFYPMSYKTFINQLPVYTDATPSQIGILSPYNNQISFFKCNLPILEAEYAAIWIAHVVCPYAPIFTDNTACMHLFRKGRFPPSWRSNYKLTKLFLETFHKPIVMYINTKKNPADIVSRAILR